MKGEKLRLLLLTRGGAETAIERLLALDCAEVAAVVVEVGTRRPASRLARLRRALRYDGLWGTARRLTRRLTDRLRVGATGRSPEPPHARLRRLAEAHRVPLHFVEDYHAEAARDLMRDVGADLGVVLGTNILKEAVFTIPRLGSINLHQGLAPYYRGGPPIFWELYNGEDKIGLTVHFVEPRVDTGAIILQERVPLVYDYAYGLDFEAFIAAYRGRLQGRSAGLVAEAVRLIAEGKARPWPQDVTLGQRYRLPDRRQKAELRRRLRERRGAARPVGQRAEAGD